MREEKRGKGEDAGIEGMRNLRGLHVEYAQDVVHTSLAFSMDYSSIASFEKTVQ